MVITTNPVTLQLEPPGECVATQKFTPHPYEANATKAGSCNSLADRAGRSPQRHAVNKGSSDLSDSETHNAPLDIQRRGVCLADCGAEISLTTRLLPASSTALLTRRLYRSSRSLPTCTTTTYDCGRVMSSIHSIHWWPCSNQALHFL